MQKIAVTELKPRMPQRHHDNRAYFEGQGNTAHPGFADTPVQARHELLLNQGLVQTSGGATLCAWVNAGRVNVWLTLSDGTAAYLDLLPSEVDSLMEKLHLGMEAV
ncbi:MAG TPA: hypothetical protein VLJ86_12565 [Ramlibacter sp.]|nr:hypothetical protein [Ramlibacter sp.]